MSRNPLIPFGLIAVVGIVAAIIFSVIGLSEQQNIAEGDEGGETVSLDPEAIAQSCMGCHGQELAGTEQAPELQNVGSRLSEEEINDIIVNGIEGTAMPGGVVSNEEAQVLAEWLASQE